MTFQEVPRNFDPNDIPNGDDSDPYDEVAKWFQAQQGQDQDSGSGDQDSEVGGTGADVPAPVPPPPPSATATDADQPDPFAGMDYQARVAYAQFLTWASQDPSRLQALDAFWRGDALPTTGSQPAAPTPTPVATPPAGSPPSQPANEQPGISLPAPLREMQEKLDAVTTVTRHVYNDYQQRQAAEVRSAIDAVSSEIKQAYNLTDEQMEKLNQAASATGLAKPLTDQHGVSMGLKKLYETTMAMEPDFRQVLINREQNRNKDKETRTRKQAALAGSSGSVTRSPAAPPPGRGTRLTNPERNAAMASMIAAAQGASDN